MYPSEFGKERMEEEKAYGPKELRETKLDSNEDNVEDKEGNLQGKMNTASKGNNYDVEIFASFLIGGQSEREQTLTFKKSVKFLKVSDTMEAASFLQFSVVSFCKKEINSFE